MTEPFEPTKPDDGPSPPHVVTNLKPTDLIDSPEKHGWKFLAAGSSSVGHDETYTRGDEAFEMRWAWSDSEATNYLLSPVRVSGKEYPVSSASDVEVAICPSGYTIDSDGHTRGPSGNARAAPDVPDHSGAHRLDRLRDRVMGIRASLQAYGYDHSSSGPLEISRDPSVWYRNADVSTYRTDPEPEATGLNLGPDIGI